MLAVAPIHVLPAQGWITQHSGVSETLTSVFFVDTLRGWAVGEGPTIIRTTDGGASWTSADFPSTHTPTLTLHSYYLSKIVFTTQHDGWIVGGAGLILHTTDGGESWSHSQIATSRSFYGVCFVGKDSGWVTGDDGIILGSTNRGATWIQQSIGSCAWLSAIFFFDRFHGWAVGDGGLVLSTTDAGSTWRKRAAVDDWLGDVHFVNRQKGWVTGDSASVYMTTDAGWTWTQQTTGWAETSWDIQFIDSLSGWAVGGTPPNHPMPPGGLVLRTTDGGSHWTPELGVTPNCLFGLHFLTPTEGWAVGASGTIIHTSTGDVVSVAEQQFDTKYQLAHNFPNPFNQNTTIEFQVGISGFASLIIFDILGREVATLMQDDLKIGNYRMTFDASQLSSGVYYYRLRSLQGVQTRAMLLLR